jgi:hypothetical protein
MRDLLREKIRTICAAMKKLYPLGGSRSVNVMVSIGG